MLCYGSPNTLCVDRFSVFTHILSQNTEMSSPRVYISAGYIGRAGGCLKSSPTFEKGSEYGRLHDNRECGHPLVARSTRRNCGGDNRALPVNVARHHPVVLSPGHGLLLADRWRLANR